MITIFTENEDFADLDLTFEFSASYRDETQKELFKSEPFIFDLKTLSGIINSAPEFTEAFENQEFIAGRAFSYTLPSVADAEEDEYFWKVTISAPFIKWDAASKTLSVDLGGTTNADAGTYIVKV